MELLVCSGCSDLYFVGCGFGVGMVFKDIFEVLCGCVYFVFFLEDSEFVILYCGV